MKKHRTAIVTAFTVEVSCPYCGDPLPSPAGSHFWELQEVADAATVDKGNRICNACDKPLRISYQSRVSCDPIAASPSAGEES